MDNNVNEVKETNEVIENTNNVVENENVQPNNTTNEKSLNICCLLSFIFSMVGIIMFGLFCGLAATILGIVGLYNFKADSQKYRWMGITGVAVGAVEFVVLLINLVVSISSVMSLF